MGIQDILINIVPLTRFEFQGSHVLGKNKCDTYLLGLSNTTFANDGPFNGYGEDDRSLLPATSECNNPLNTDSYSNNTQNNILIVSPELFLLQNFSTSGK